MQTVLFKRLSPLLVMMLLTGLLMPVAAQAQEPVSPQPLPEAPVVAPEMLPPADYRPSPVVVDLSETDAASVASAPLNYDVATIDAAAAGAFRALMPITAREWAPIAADRMGFGAGTRPVDSWPQVRSLNAGWYVDWAVRVNPPRPSAMQYMPMVRLHQDLVCGRGVTADRTLCPYKVPYTYSRSPSVERIQQAARANPGSVWLIGNEMDRVDWVGGYQDEMLPEVYARAFHETRLLIRTADPTAKFAIGGVIQFTPLRAEYLTKVWDAYKARYGVNMPVDVWNVHNFIGPEICQTETLSGVPTRVCYGMAIPTGVKGRVVGKQELGAYINENWKVISKATFEEQIRGMRQWMKDRGQGNKPLIVTEYGVLWSSLCSDESYPTPAAKQKCIDSYGANYKNLEDPAVIHDFMLWSFEFFRTEKDCNLVTGGYDECRLVQQWAWFGLDDIGWSFNPHAVLMDTATNLPTAAGVAYRNYVNSNYQTLQLPNGRLP